MGNEGIGLRALPTTFLPHRRRALTVAVLTQSLASAVCNLSNGRAGARLRRRLLDITCEYPRPGICDHSWQIKYNAAGAPSRVDPTTQLLTTIDTQK